MQFIKTVVDEEAKWDKEIETTKLQLEGDVLLQKNRQEELLANAIARQNKKQEGDLQELSKQLLSFEKSSKRKLTKQLKSYDLSTQKITSIAKKIVNEL